MEEQHNPSAGATPPPAPTPESTPPPPLAAEPPKPPTPEPAAAGYQPSYSSTPTSYDSGGAKEQHASKTWIFVLLGIIVVAALVFAGWWFLKDGFGKAKTPDELFLGAITTLMSADDTSMQIDIPFDTLLAVSGDYSETAEDSLDEYGLKFDGAKVMLQAQTAYTETLRANANTSISIVVPETDTAVGFGVRVVDGDIFVQLSEFKVEEFPFSLDALTGTWIEFNIAEIMEQFAAGAGDDSSSVEVASELQAGEYLTLDRGVALDLFQEQYTKHKPFVITADAQASTDDIAALRVQVSGQFSPFVYELLDKTVTWQLNEIDVAIGEYQKDGEQVAVGVLEGYRMSLVESSGEHGELLAEQIVDFVGQIMPAAEGDASSSSGFSFDTPESADLAIEEAILTLFVDTDSGEPTQATLDFVYVDASTHDPITLQWDGINTGLKITKPENSKTIEEMLPVVMGIVFGGLGGEFGATFGSEDGDQEGTLIEGELFESQTPNTLDSDGDGISNRDELGIWGTNKDLVDSDFDGYDDKTELENGFNPLGQGKLEVSPLFFGEWRGGATFGISDTTAVLVISSDGTFTTYEEKDDGTEEVGSRENGVWTQDGMRLKLVVEDGPESLFGYLENTTKLELVFFMDGNEFDPDGFELARFAKE